MNVASDRWIAAQFAHSVKRFPYNLHLFVIFNLISFIKMK